MLIYVCVTHPLLACFKHKQAQFRPRPQRRHTASKSRPPSAESDTHESQQQQVITQLQRTCQLLRHARAMALMVAEERRRERTVQMLIKVRFCPLHLQLVS